jgi:predicted permease
MRSDLRDALRSLARDPSFALLATLLLSLTIGATTAVYAVVDAVLLRPMGLVSEDRTVVIWQAEPARSTPVVEVALGEVDTWRRHASSFDALGVFGSVNWPLTLLDGDSRTRAPYASVSSSFFTIVGTPPALGRVLDVRDEAGSVPRAVVISHGLWTLRFGADPRIVGRTIRVQTVVEAPERSVEIVGVMPAGFEFPRGAALWLPAAPEIRAAARPNPADPADVAWYLAHFRVFYALGRLRDGATAARARDELAGILRRAERDSSTGAPSQAVVTPVEDYVVGPAKPVLWTMLGGALLMVLLACSSAAGLQLFRSAQQDRAFAIRLALGASRSRLVRRSLIDSALVSTASVVGSVAVAWAVTRALVAAAPLDVPRLATATVGAPAVLVVMLILAAATGMLSSVWPSTFIGGVDAGRTLTAGARAAMHPRERRLQRFIVGWQVAVAVILLSGAALFVRSVQRLDRTVLGFNPEGLVSVEVEPSVNDLDRWDQFYDALLARVGRLPHVTSAGAVYLRPLSGPIGNDTIPVLAGQEGLGADAPWRGNPRANLEAVTPDYFRTIGTRLLVGRGFTRDDRAASPNVVIVSASAAARYWPGRDPINQPILVPTQRAAGSREQPRWQTVVGVVEDVRYRGITDPRLDLYLPAAQSTSRVKHLLVRSRGTPLQVAADVRAIARDLDPQVHVGEITTMDEALARETAPWRFAKHVLGACGALAAVLATVGLLGQVSLVVSLRRRELGIRAALGATPGRLRAHVLSEAARTSATATLVGVLGALALGRLVAGLLVETTPHDPVSIGGAAALTLAASLVGCLLPARRAAASDPTQALRD